MIANKAMISTEMSDIRFRKTEHRYEGADHRLESDRKVFGKDEMLLIGDRRSHAPDSRMKPGS
jgi:hypothetical protein